jgi:hypothetical protein
VHLPHIASDLAIFDTSLYKRGVFARIPHTHKLPLMASDTATVIFFVYVKKGLDAFLETGGWSSQWLAFRVSQGPISVGSRAWQRASAEKQHRAAM